MLLVAFGGGMAMGGGGLLLGWKWALAGFALGFVAAGACYPVVAVFTLPDPETLLRTGRPREALERIEQRLPSSRLTARRWPSVFREVLAFDLLIKSEALRALDKVPQALDTIDEAVTIYRQLMAANPARRLASNLADALYQQASLLGALSRHGEALGAVEVAIRLYRDLAVVNRGEYLPALADALTRQADALGYLDRLDQARAAADEATLIRTDMLPAGQLRRAG
jgi:tetratricopeptide (TPR) repeat protein